MDVELFSVINTRPDTRCCLVTKNVRELHDESEDTQALLGVVLYTGQTGHVSYGGHTLISFVCE